MLSLTVRHGEVHCGMLSSLPASRKSGVHLIAPGGRMAAALAGNVTVGPQAVVREIAVVVVSERLGLLGDEPVARLRVEQIAAARASAGKAAG